MDGDSPGKLVLSAWALGFLSGLWVDVMGLPGPWVAAVACTMPFVAIGVYVIVDFLRDAS